VASYCVECGANVEHNFKFCPNCGSEINLSTVSSPQNLKDAASKTRQVIICSNCGDENSLNSIVCHSCGVKLDKSKTVNANLAYNNLVISQPKIERIKPKKQGKPQNKSKNQSITVNEKKLENKTIFALIGVSAVAVALILIASGVIDLSSKKIASTEAGQQNQSSGIDLSTITKINEVKNIVDNNPNNASAILDLANLRFDSGFFEDALKNYDQYLKLEPKNAEARIDMAVCYYNIKQFDKAESEILTALKYSPNHQTGFLNLGVIYLAKQNVEKAKEWFNKAVELDPNSEIGKKAKSLLQSH
jgi:tetratricopeptide (TPR) repeat protein